MAKHDPEELKKRGFLKQKQPNLYSVRLRLPAGNLTSEQMHKIAEASKQSGTGKIHITTRQSIEIRDVPLEKIDYLVKSLDEEGLQPGSCGPRVRNIVACGGNRYCQNGITDAEDLAYAIDNYFFGRNLPAKIKIAVSGCPNSCSKPQENDIGLVGMIKPELDYEACTGCGLCAEICGQEAITTDEVKPKVNYGKCRYDGACIQACPEEAWSGIPGYAMLIGGKIGREPQLGYKLIDFIAESDMESVFRIIENTIDCFGKNAGKGERMGDLINRVGIETFRKSLNTIK